MWFPNSTTHQHTHTFFHGCEKSCEGRLEYEAKDEQLHVHVIIPHTYGVAICFTQLPTIYVVNVML